MSRSSNDIIETIAHSVWHRDHNGAECQPFMVPSLEALREWLPACPRDVADLVSEAAAMFLPPPSATPFPPNPDREWGPWRWAAYAGGGLWLMRLSCDGAGDVFSLPEVDHHWYALPRMKQNPPAHPLVPLIRGWQNRARSLEERHLIVPASMAERRAQGQPARPLVRVPALLDLGLTAIEVDGEAFATATPGGKLFQEYRAPRKPTQGELFPAPRKLAGWQTDPILRLMAGFRLAGDERNPLRGDVIALARFIFAVSGSVEIPLDMGAIFIGGKDTPANRRRWLDAVECVRSLTLKPANGRGWYDIATASMHADGETVSIAPPIWWTEGKASRFRLTAGLLRPRAIETERRGPDASNWGALTRTADALEALLSYGPTAGRGRHGRIPDALRPAHGQRIGPGPDVFVPWRGVLTASGEHVPPDADAKDEHGRRYRRRIQMLEVAGYMTQGRDPAPAGDGIEIVRVVRGGRGRPGGVMVRATARFTEAVRRAQNHVGWTRLPAIVAFPQPAKAASDHSETPE